MMTIQFPNLTPFHLGFDEFQRRLHLLRRIGEFHAADDFDLYATRDPTTHERVGYTMKVRDEIIAAWVRDGYSRVLRGEPMPWVLA